MSKNGEIMTFWMSPEEKKIIKEVANKNRMSMSNLVRVLISQNIKNLKTDSMLKLVSV